MNERIVELAEKAGLEYNFDPMTWLKHEKFAELIVRECMDQVAEFNRLTKTYQSQGIDPEIDVTKEVLKNFGFTRFPRS